MLLNSFQAFVEKLNRCRTWTAPHHRRKIRRKSRSSLPNITALESLETRTLLSSQNGFLYNPNGYLTAPAAGDPEGIARNYLTANTAALGIVSNDLANLTLTGRTTGGDGQLTNLYFQQTYNGIPIDSGTANVTVDSQGRVLSVGNRLVASLPSRVNSSPATLTAPQAINSAASILVLASPTGVTFINSSVVNGNTVYYYTGGTTSRDIIPVKQVYSLAPDNSFHIAWNITIHLKTSADWYNVNVDARTGAQLYVNNWTRSYNDEQSSSGTERNAAPGTPAPQFAITDPDSNLATGSYNVYPLPLVSPKDGARVLVTDPQDNRASPYGWHDINGVPGADFTTTQGNNAYVQEDVDGDDLGGFRPDGGPNLNFDYPLDLLQPSTYGTNQSAAITQLFYTANTLHDIYYQYGFDETSGNFQVNNYGRGGLANDQLIADVDDFEYYSIGTFAAPPDGVSPRMQFHDYWNGVNSGDMALANDVIIHEYTHGVTSRLTGGPSNANALSSVQSRALAEGWSDFWALMLTQRASDPKTLTSGYTFGTWRYGQYPADYGIRQYPYSYNMTIDPRTLAYFNESAQAHDAGGILTSALWDLNWLYRDRYGFSGDFYDGTAGNNKLMQTVMDALKLQPGNPSFLDARDAILAADQVNSGSANSDIIWQAFARRGMGVYAYDGGADSTVVGENFNTPGSTQDDFPDTYRDAPVIDPNSLTSGWIGTSTDIDFLQFFYEGAGDNFTIKLEFPTDKFSPAPSATMSVYAFGNTLVASGNTISFNGFNTGSYYIKISDLNPAEIGGYTVRLTRDDVGSTPATARQIAVGTRLGGDLELPGDADYYAFTVTAGQGISFDLSSNDILDTTLTLYASNGTTQILSTYPNDRLAGAAPSHSVFGYPFSTAGTYYLRVGSRSNSSRGTYQLSIYQGSTLLDFIGSDAISAIKLNSLVGASSKINIPGDSDWYGVMLQAGTKYSFTALADNSNGTPLSAPRVELYDRDGRTGLTSNPASLDTLYYTPVRSGRYYAVVRTFTPGGTGDFDLLSAADIVDDHSDRYQFATPVTVPSIKNGNIQVALDMDMFKFHAIAGKTYDLINDRLTLDQSYLDLLAPDGYTLINTSNGGGVGTDLTPQLSFTPTETGDYYVSIRGNSINRRGTYTLQIKEHNAAPVLNSSTLNIPAIPEDIADAANIGVLVTDILASLLPGQLTDANPTDPQGLGIFIANNNDGVWQYSSNNGTSWTPIGNPNNGNVLLLPAAPNWRVRFVPPANFFGASWFHFYAWDQSSGTPGSTINGNIRGGDSSLSESSVAVWINIDSVNDAPVIGSPGNPLFPTLTEDPADAANTGLLVSELIANLVSTGGSISDVDPSPLQGLAFAAADQTHGLWQFSLDNGTNWADFGTVSTSSALLLASDANTRVRFKPNPNDSGIASLTFYAWDRTTGTAGSTLDATTRGGSTPFSQNSSTAQVTVTSVNDAPVITNPGAPLFPTLIEDPSDATNTGILVSQLLAGLVSTGGALSDNDNDPLGLALSAADQSHGNWQFSLDNGTTWSNIGAVSTSSALLLASDATTRLRFKPHADDSGNASLTFYAWDRTTGTAGSTADATTRGDTTSFSQNSSTAQITVTPVNDAPTLTNTGNPRFPTLTEDPSDASNTGLLVSQLISNLVTTGGSIGDVDGNPLGLAFSVADQSHGIWQFSLNNGTTWSDFGDVSTTSARLLASDATTRLRFKPAPNYFGSSTLTFVAWDQTAGTNGGTAIVTSRGFSKPFSLGFETASVTITSVNDAPVLGGTGIASLIPIPEDSTDVGNTGTSVAQILTNFTNSGGTYVDDDAAALRGIAITSLDNSHGNWECTIDGGTTWIGMGTAPSAAAAWLFAATSNNKIRFIPSHDYNGPANFQFVAWDQTTGTNGGTAVATNRGGSKAFSLVVKSATITVTPVNDAPVLTNSTDPVLTAIPRGVHDAANTGTPVSQITSQLIIYDVDSNTAPRGLAITSMDNSHGTWEFTTDNGANWTPFGTPSASNARLLAANTGTKMRFKPAPGFVGTASFLFVAWDQSTGTNGGTASVTNRGGTKAFSLVAETASINVFVANNAPILNAAGNPTLTTITKNIPDTANNGTLVSEMITNLTNTGGGISDLDAGSPQGIAVTSVNNANGIWQYSLNNGTTWLDFGSPAAATARLLASDPNTRIRFKPAANYTGAATFVFVAWDQAAGVNGSTLSATTRGNATPFSLNYDTATIKII